MDLRSLPAFWKVFRRFLPDTVRIEALLNIKLQKGQPIPFEKIFEGELLYLQTQQMIIFTPPMLSLPRPMVTYTLDTDACNDQLDALSYSNRQTHQTRRLVNGSDTLTTCNAHMTPRIRNVWKRSGRQYYWNHIQKAPHSKSKQITMRFARILTIQVRQVGWCAGGCVIWTRIQGCA